VSRDFSREKLERARTLLQRAHSSSEPGTQRHARISTLLSETHGYLGNFEEAYLLNETVRRYARTHDDVRLRAFSLLKLGVLHVQTERWARADTTLSRALARAQELGDLDYQRRVLHHLGRLHEMQDQWAAAERFYRDGVAVVERYRESLTASQWSMTAFAQWQEVHRGLVRALLAQGRSREALLALDRSRARHLLDLRTRARVSKQLPPEKRVRLDSLTRALTDVRTRLGAVAPADTSVGELRNREARLMAARQQLLDLDTMSASRGLDAIAERLAEQDRALVSYFLDDPWPVFDRSPRSVAFVLTADTLRTVPLSGLTQDSVQAHVEAVSPLFASRDEPSRANAMHFDLRPLHTLHDALYAPVAERLPADQPLTVVPDGPLFRVPPSMLVRSMPGGRFAPSEARFVLHDRPIALELSSSLLAEAAQQSFDWSTFKPKMAAYGVSDFDTLRAVPPVLRRSLPEVDPGSTMALPSLPGVRDELRALQSTISDAQISLNGRATERRFCRSVRRAGVLHVASHTVVNDVSPLQNAILLRPDAVPDAGTSPASATDSASTDGVLFLHELEERPARIPMVVLSGCSTASGTLRGGEGMEGLQYAFRAMGAQSTVSTLWPVADRASIELMRSFYRNLRDGDPKDVALREAQLAFLENHPQKASPFFWAPSVLYGSPSSLPLTGPLLPRWAWWALGLVVGLGGLGTGWFFLPRARRRSSASSP
jgi:CHAT domain-containing protein